MKDYHRICFLYCLKDSLLIYIVKIARSIYIKLNSEIINWLTKVILNIVKYYENQTTETAGLTFVVEYKLVSNLTGEVLVSDRKNIQKNYNESWKTYYISSFRIDKKKQIPSDEKEKHVPAKQEIYKAAFHEMFDTINKDINSLPSVK